MIAQNKWLLNCALGGTLLLAAAAPAEVLSVGASGFEVRETVHVAVSADEAFAVLLRPQRWWSSQHTFSGSAANLSLQARVGGCWCEKLPGGGSVEHLRVVYFSPGKVLRLRGALGPFQTMAVDGVMTWSTQSSAEGSDISVSYAIGGFSKDGFEVLAKAADRVLAEQIERLRKTIAP